MRSAEDRKLLEADQLEELLRASTLALVVDHFDYDLDNLDFNRQKLRFLQRFAFDEARTVIVVSSVYPLYFKITDEAKSEDKAPVAAWSEVLEPLQAALLASGGACLGDAHTRRAHVAAGSLPLSGLVADLFARRAGAALRGRPPAIGQLQPA